MRKSERDDRLHTGNFKAFAAPQVLAHQHVVFPHHVGAELGKSGTITLVSAGWQLGFLRSYQPHQFIFLRLVTMGTIERSRLLLSTLVEEISFFHKKASVHYRPTCKLLHNWRVDNDSGCSLEMARKKKAKAFRASKAIKAVAREQIGSPQPTRFIPDRKKRQPREKHKIRLDQLLEE